MIVSGFCKEVFKELPMEFALEAQQLLGITLEGQRRLGLQRCGLRELRDARCEDRTQANALASQSQSAQSAVADLHELNTCSK